MTWTTTSVSPSSVRFSQVQVSERFKHSQFSIEENVRAFIQGIESPRVMPPIRVVSLAGTFVTLDNRRLAVWRILEMAGIVSEMEVDVVEELNPEILFELLGKFSTENAGISVIVGRGPGVIGVSSQDTTFLRPAAPNTPAPLPRPKYRLTLARSEARKKTCCRNASFFSVSDDAPHRAPDLKRLRI